MSNDRYYGTAAKSRRSTPALDAQQSSGFFAAGQGGRTVLPPIASAFPTSRSPVPIDTYSTFSQHRYSPSRNDYDASYTEWNTSSPQPNIYYETHDPRHSQPHSHNSYPSPVSPTMQLDSHDHRKLPPLDPVTTSRDDRWHPISSYPTASSHMHPASNQHIRSPTAVYPSAYPGSSQTVPYVYPSMTPYDHRTYSPPDERNYSRATNSRNDHRNNASYIPSPVSPPTYMTQRAAPVADDGTVVKKKRKRADAQQLKVLNDTYNRTAFPSTAERESLARRLDMSARSVQIWFQNKRQSLRQTKSQTSNASGTQPYVVSPQAETANEQILQATMVSGYSDSHAFIPRSMQDTSTSSHHHHGRYDDGGDSRTKRSSRAGY